MTAAPAPPTGVAAVPAGAVDLSLHGLARLRLLDAAPADVRAVVRQVGPLEVPAEGAADLVVRFVDGLPPAPGERLLGAREAAFSADGFVVLRSKHKARARVRVPLHRAGTPGCELVCERGLPAVPLLVPLLNLAVLAGGALPLHACAFRTAEGVGAVTTGWSKGGKTEALLAFCERGATYVGDEWVYLPGDGTAAGIPEPIRVWDWHLDSLPGYRDRLPRSSRARLAVLRRATALARRVPAEPRQLSRLADRMAPVLEGQAHVDIDPTALFGAELGPLSTPVDRLFLVMSADRPDVVAAPVDPAEVAARMAASLAFERLDLRGWYLRARYAHPEASWSNPLLEGGAEELERDLLERFLAGVPAWVVEHPYPVDLSALHDVMAPLCREGA